MVTTTMQPAEYTEEKNCFITRIFQRIMPRLRGPERFPRVGVDNKHGMKGLTQVVWDGGSLVNSLTEFGNLFLFSYSPATKSLVAWSDNAETVLGVRDVAIARDANLFLRHVHPDDRFLLFSELEQAMRGEIPYRATYRWIRPDNNEERWIHCRARLVSSSGDALFEGVMLDLSNELTGSVGRLTGPDALNTVLEALPSMVFTLDHDFRLLRLNRPKSFGITNFGDPNFKAECFKIGRPFLDCFSDEGQKNHLQSVLTKVLEGRQPSYRTRIFYDNSVQNFEVAPISDHGAIEGLLCLVSDITELVRLEKQLAEVHKSEGLRLLAAGVAHHFNNSLQSIIGHATVIESHLDKPDLVRQSSRAIIEIVNKNSDLSRQLFVFDDLRQTRLAPVDINLAVMAAANGIEDLFSSGLKIGVVFGNVPLVSARQAELVEAIQAVLHNARESLGADNDKQHDKAGHISIKTYEVVLNELEVSDLRAGHYVKVVMADSGGGMQDETRRRCFEPFYTTKERDPRTGLSLTGSGLGLSKAFSVIREFGGSMTVESQPGMGTTLSIYLPAKVPDLASEENNRALEPQPTERIQRPDILIIDDDGMVLKTISTILSELGYGCLTAEDSASALSMVKTYRATLQLILLDAVMPGCDSASILRRIKRINSEIKVIGFSGASAEQTKFLLEEGALQILRKPVDPRTLKDVVRQALQTKRAA
jgi:signal transduction histidine kinase/ActR/RegA family two-component response regulator